MKIRLSFRTATAVISRSFWVTPKDNIEKIIAEMRDSINVPILGIIQKIC